MKICIFGAASDKIKPIFIEQVENLGEILAKMGHSLVFGGGATGLMGAAARGFKKGCGYIHGVIPKFFEERGVEIIYQQCDVLSFTETMSERKRMMEDLCDAFIITPGGIGTYEEFFEVLTLKQLGRHTKPIIIWNIDGYYNSMLSLMTHTVAEKFMAEKCLSLYEVCDDVKEVLEKIEKQSNYSTWEDYKKG